MTKEERLSWVSFEGLAWKIQESGLTRKEFADRIGIGVSSIRNCINGNMSFGTETVAAMAAFFKCGVNELMEFKGYEIKERYKTPFFIPYEPNADEPGVSYEPLRLLFKSAYGDNWNEKMREFYDKVDVTFHCPDEVTEKHIERLNKIRAELHPNPTRAGEKSYRNGGLTSVTRSRLRRNGNLNLKNIYNICKVLGCTPDYVMTYR